MTRQEMRPSVWPSYLSLYESGELARRAARAWRRLRCCTLCPRRCRVNRLEEELGSCRTGSRARVASAGPHYGEEAPLVGRGGSGTIFFAGCNLACIYCQNHDISQLESDEISAPVGLKKSTLDDEDAGGCGTSTRKSSHLLWEMEPAEIAEIMLRLQRLGCENINLVSPSHVVPQILAALLIAVEGGLRLPLVYNTGGYDALSTLRLLDGVVDIYMPDMKYADEAVGLRLSGVPDYVRCNRAAVLEMHRQVGDLELDDRGVARRGLLVRHLVLPGGLAGTAEVAKFIATEISPDTYINVMDQYRPEHKVLRGASFCLEGCETLGRRLRADEFLAAVQAVRAAGLWRLDGLVL